MKSSYLRWGCNHCLVCHFVGGVSDNDVASVQKTARDHIWSHGHSVELKKVVDGETACVWQLGVKEATQNELIVDGRIVKDV